MLNNLRFKINNQTSCEAIQLYGGIANNPTSNVQADSLTYDAKNRLGHIAERYDRGGHCC